MENINKDWNITLSDFSEGMLESSKESLKPIGNNFTYAMIDAQDIPYEDESFDIVIANHMLYFVPDIEKALGEIKRILVKGGSFYATTTSSESMLELNELVKKFDSKMGLNNNGMCQRFELENGQLLLKKYFNEVKMDTLEGKIIVQDAEPIVSYKASTIKGSSILVGEKKKEFRRYIEEYIKRNGKILITTKACIFKAKK
jgi:ubiquinone/menaquinone biosynthesis C-methylase UbiE